MKSMWFSDVKHPPTSSTMECSDYGPSLEPKPPVLTDVRSCSCHSSGPQSDAARSNEESICKAKRKEAEGYRAKCVQICSGCSRISCLSKVGNNPSSESFNVETFFHSCHLSCLLGFNELLQRPTVCFQSLLHRFQAAFGT